MTMGTNAPIGLQPVAYLNGAPWIDNTRPYFIASGYGTSIFKGDPVILGTDGNLAIATAGAAVIGVFWGCLYQLPTGPFPVTPSNYWPASTALASSLPATAFVIDDPNVIFSIQETNASGVAGTHLTQTNVGQNFNWLMGSGTTLTGISTTSLNNASGSPGSDSTLNMKIIGLDGAGTNVLSSQGNVTNVIGNFANWLVIINNHKYKGGTGTVGHS